MKKINLTFVIEDDEITAFLIPKILQHNKYFNEVQTFENGYPATEYLFAALKKNGTLPDLILLDINMPEMDGWEFLNEIAKNPKLVDIPVFMLTSSIHEEDIKKAKSYKNVIGYFTKPLEEYKVMEMLAMLDQKH